MYMYICIFPSNQQCVVNGGTEAQQYLSLTVGELRSFSQLFLALRNIVRCTNLTAVCSKNVAAAKIIEKCSSMNKMKGPGHCTSHHYFFKCHLSYQYFQCFGRNKNVYTQCEMECFEYYCRLCVLPSNSFLFRSTLDCHILSIFFYFSDYTRISC